jgi:hypothetical protein
MLLVRALPGSLHEVHGRYEPWTCLLTSLPAACLINTYNDTTLASIEASLSIGLLYICRLTDLYQHHVSIRLLYVQDTWNNIIVLSRSCNI